MTECVDFFAFERSVPGAVPKDVAAAFALMVERSEKHLREYDWKLKNGHGKAMWGSEELKRIDELENVIVSLVVGSIKSQFKQIDKRAKRMYCTADYANSCEGTNSCIAMSRYKGPFDNRASALVWLKAKGDRCVGTLELNDGEDRDNQVIREVVDAASFDDAYDFIEAQEGVLTDEMDQLLEEVLAERSKDADGVGAES